jgi:hypothetical protein
MLKDVGVFVTALTLSLIPFSRLVPATVNSGQTQATHRHWFRKKNVLWFNGYPGWPKLPLVQRLRASPSDLDPVVPSQPEEEEEGEDSDEDRKPLRSKVN